MAVTDALYAAQSNIGVNRLFLNLKRNQPGKENMKDIEIPDDAYPVMACLPADPGTWDRAGFVHINVPKSYIKDTCSMCSCEVYMGPLQQEFVEKHPETIIQCFECTIKIIGTGNIAGVAALNDDDQRETCTMFTKKGKILGPRNSNN